MRSVDRTDASRADRKRKFARRVACRWSVRQERARKPLPRSAQRLAPRKLCRAASMPGGVAFGKGKVGRRGENPGESGRKCFACPARFALSAGPFVCHIPQKLAAASARRPFDAVGERLPSGRRTPSNLSKLNALLNRVPGTPTPVIRSQLGVSPKTHIAPIHPPRSFPNTYKSTRVSAASPRRLRSDAIAR